jgi:hypothetical protein
MNQTGFKKEESPPGALASGLPAGSRSEFTIATEEDEWNKVYTLLAAAA